MSKRQKLSPNPDPWNLTTNLKEIKQTISSLLHSNEESPTNKLHILTTIHQELQQIISEIDDSRRTLFASKTLLLDGFEMAISSTKSELFKYLSFKDVLSFASTSSTIFQIVSLYESFIMISAKYTFKQPCCASKYKMHRPAYLRVSSLYEFPKSAKSIEFSQDFNNAICLSGFPALTHIKFGLRFNSNLDLHLLSSLAHLSFGYCFDHAVDLLPPSLTHLTFGYYFNRSVDSLPPSLTHITFGDYFNITVDLLPSSLTHLTFGDYFNQPVNSLPPSLTYLALGKTFNQPVDSLPPSLTHLIFGRAFDQSVDSLPPSLTHLIFGDNFAQVANSLPRSITLLSFEESYSLLLSSLPPSLTLLKIKSLEQVAAPVPPECQIWHSGMGDMKVMANYILALFSAQNK